ncbi:potassium channel family protein [Streptomyces sp. NPDC088725]|uniref:potassium channel family protein n=1 Tax=Streptomyces sp. NPDC088725 TaxID=3365873 RepID=UPI00380660FA
MPPPSFVYLLRRLLRSTHGHRLHVQAAVWAAVITVLFLLGGSWLIVPVEESAPHATITSFPKALWWSIETATTVGYGDFFPVTAAGRVIASVVMVVGIASFSIVTAAIATWFVGGAMRRVRRAAAGFELVERKGRTEASDEMRVLHERFDRLERLLEDSGRPGDS